MNMVKRVFAIQAQRAGTKNQPSPEGLGPWQAVERRRRGTTLLVCSLGEVVTFFDFSQKGLLIDVATAPTTALALGNGPLLSTTLSFLSSRPGFPATLRWTRLRVRLSRKERRMKFASATNLNRKSGVA
jgi:hypothetical protein